MVWELYHNQKNRNYKHWLNAAIIAAGALFLALFMLKMCGREPMEHGEVVKDKQTPEYLYSPLADMIYPTEYNLLNHPEDGQVFQRTGSNRPESAHYGSTRTAASRRGPIPSFHEAVDIAPAERDSGGRPLDVIKAVADGTVAHTARSRGGSSYGCYVVIIHDDPIGPVYTLYAHLASVDKKLKVNEKIAAGTPLGIMGNTASYNIPMVRAHLHLEIGLMLNSRFGKWARANGIRPDRGNHHGWNLKGVDPLAVYRVRHKKEHFTFADYLATVPAAFELVLDTKQLPNYFELYPSLWRGVPYKQGGIVISVLEGGAVSEGRIATPEEQAALDKAGKPFPQKVNEEVLGRNGRRIVQKRGGTWTLGTASKRWIDVFLY